MHCLRRIALSRSAIVASQLRNFRLLPSLHSEATNTGDDSKGATTEIKEATTGIKGATTGTGGSKSSSLFSYDMVIVGDGPVSSALACSIGCEPSLSHRKVLLLQPEGRGREVESSGKVSILLQSSVSLLKRIGAWSELVAKSVVKPFKSVHISDAHTDAHVVFNCSNVSKDDRDDLEVPGLHDDGQSETSDSDDGIIGYVVSNQSLVSSLLEKVASYDNVQLETKAKAKVIRKVDNMTNPLVRVMLDNGHSITSNLLVGADGPNSRVCQLGGFYRVGWNYDQWVFTAAVEVKEAGNNSSVWQRLLPSGPITMLPLSESTSALMWCTNKEHAQSLVSMTNPETVVDAINYAFFDTLPQNDLLASVSEAVRDTVGIFSSEAPPPHRLPPLVATLLESSRAAAPLALAHTPNYVKDRIVLIGDASHQMHPLTGLGLNLGLGDVASLTEKLLDANSKGDDWALLIIYWCTRQRGQRENVPTMVAVEGFNRLSSSSSLH